jgi:hypothetical protein
VVGLVAIRLNLVEKPRSVFVAWLVGAAVNVAASFALLGSAVGSPAALGESALQAAAWAGVAGVTASLAVCLALAAREGVGLRWRAVALGIVGYAAGLGWPVIVPVLVVILAAALTTELVFSTQERLQLRSSIARLMGR